MGKTNTLNRQICEDLLMENDEVSIRIRPEKDRIQLTRTRFLTKIISENKIASDLKFCKIINTYRDGKKTGMQVISTEDVILSNEKNCQVGNHNEQPVTGHSLTSAPNNDTAL